MSTDDNDAYGDLDKSNLKFIYGQFLYYNAVLQVLPEAKLEEQLLFFLQ